MKVADIIKLVGNSTEVFVYRHDESWECALDREWDYGKRICENWTEANGCGDCVYLECAVHEWESFRGRGENVPIKLADKKVIAIDALARKGKRKHDCFPVLGIKVENAG